MARKCDVFERLKSQDFRDAVDNSPSDVTN